MSTGVVSRLELPLLHANAGGKSNSLGERLDLVGHVKVKLTVTLGSAEMSIDRLFSLAANDVVTLDRDADSPVDIKLNDKVIARGMLVAAGDKFGVRITEISAEA